MPSNLLKSSPVDTSPPVVILPPNIVEIQVDGVMEQIDIYCELACIEKEDHEEDAGNEQNKDLSRSTPAEQPDASTNNTTTGKTGRRGKLLNRSLKRSKNSQSQEGGRNGEMPKASARKSLKNQQGKEEKKLPEAKITILEDYRLTECPPRPNNAYIRYIERTPEELAEIVEYDLDQEDLCWLELVNRQRKQMGITPTVIPAWMEEIMDKLEKESFYMSSAVDQGSLIDDDAVCCICNDGECQNANAILFCDMCNLAVHQECYGVPYIPEGQWLCRRCFFSPSRPVACVLCPNTGGAFKQTECKRWAHVVCAIWIPEVCFSNTVFLEPIDNINAIPAARWRLTCFICKEKNRGACIQCIKNNCYTAFHVTCAQSAGLCMRMDPDSDRGVKKKAWCPSHAPADFVAEQAKASSTGQQRLKDARKKLAEKRKAPPMVLIPTISPDKIAQISSKYNFRRKDPFMRLVMAYWKLKRCSRNGVPLLRRLQITNTASAAGKSSRKGDASQGGNSQQNYADTLRVRQDLEKGRLLCELTRKREKTKREFIYVTCDEWDIRIQAFNYFLASIIDELVVKDTQSIFTQPVDPEMVPDYLTVITNPMDLSTMRKKIFEFEYETIDELHTDFELMISNCRQYNSKDTLFYRAASRMQELGGIVFREAKRAYDRLGFLPGGVMSENPPPQYFSEPPEVNDAEVTGEIEQVLEDMKRHELSFQDHLTLLQEILDKSLNLTNPTSRKKKFLKIRKEIYRLKRSQMLEEGGEEESVSGARDVSSMDEDEAFPSVFGGDVVESSDVGEDGVEHGASKSQQTSIRRRLRSTDHNEQLQQRLMQVSASIPTIHTRRLSRSSESVGVRLPAPAMDCTSYGRTSSQSSSPATSSRRGRGRPPKVLSQGCGRGASVVRSGGRSISPLKQSPTVASQQRRGTAFRGRHSNLRRNLRRPLRRSARVDNLQKQAQVQHSNPNTSPEKEVSESSRHASPGRSASPPKSSRSSRHVSPILTPLKSQQTARGSGVQSRQIRTPSQRSPQAAAKTLSKQQVGSSASASDTNVSPGSRGRGRPPRNRAVKLANKNQIDSIGKVDPASSKSMEAAAKSIVCEDRHLPRTGRKLLQQKEHLNDQSNSAKKSLRRRILVDTEEDDDMRREANDGGAGATSPVSRKNSVVRGSALLQNLKAARKSTTNSDASIKGPAGAVGRRKKSINSDLSNGPMLRKLSTGGQPPNGISPTAVSPVRQLNSPIKSPPTRKRPRRAAVNAVAHHNNSLVTSSMHHHHNHPSTSFSVYRNTGTSDEDFSSDESLDEGEEEEEDDNDEYGVEDDEEDDDEEEDDGPAENDELSDDNSEQELSLKDLYETDKTLDEGHKFGSKSHRKETSGSEKTSSESDSESNNSDTSCESSISATSACSKLSSNSSSSSITNPKHFHSDPAMRQKILRKHKRPTPAILSKLSSSVSCSSPPRSRANIRSNQTHSPDITTLTSQPTNYNNNNNIYTDNGKCRNLSSSSSGSEGDNAADPSARPASSGSTPARRLFCSTPQQ